MVKPGRFVDFCERLLFFASSGAVQTPQGLFRKA